jgi:acyl-CoA reductase-like NAD-dependent aldehyde dehydrogenase
MKANRAKESFGPVAYLTPFQDDEEEIQLAKSTD